MALLDNIIAIYHMNDTWLDSSGNGHTLSPTGATFDNVNAKLGSAAGKFDGLNDSSLSTIATGFSGSFSINAWARPVSTPAGAVDVAIASNVVSYGNFWWAILPVSTGKWRCTMFDGSANPTVDSTSSFTLNQFSMITLVRDIVEDTLQIHVNGVFENQVTDNTTVTPVYSDFTLGGQPAVGGRWFDGQLDEVTPFARVLSPTEILGLWNGGAGVELAPVAAFNPAWARNSNQIIGAAQ